MTETNSSGSALHKNKSINVEVNLLAEWLSERDRLGAQIRRMMALLVVLMVMAGLILPMLNRMRKDAAVRAAEASSNAAAVALQLQTLEKQKEAIKPQLDNQILSEKLLSQSRRFLGESVAILNAVDATAVINTMKIEVMGGEMTVRCQADAESYSAARRFADTAGLGSGVKSSLLSSTRRSDKLSPGSVSFEYIKLIGVEQ